MGNSMFLDQKNIYSASQALCLRSMSEDSCLLLLLLKYYRFRLYSKTAVSYMTGVSYTENYMHTFSFSGITESSFFRSPRAS